MTGGLFDPLGTDPADLPRRGVRPSVPVLAAGLVLAALAVLLAVSWLRDDGDRGRPMAVAPIEHVEAPPKPPAPAPLPAQPAAPPLSALPSPALSGAPMPAASAGLPPVRDDQEVEIQNGVRIIRPRRERPATGGQTIRVPGAEAPR